MSNVVIQFRRGSTSNHSTFAGQAGEITVDSTKHTAVVHDGSTNGGFPLSKEGHTHLSANITDLKYKIVQIATTPQTARTNLNFSSLFSASDDSGNDRTTLTLANNNTSGAGTYGSATQVAQVTLSATGLVTSVSQVTVAGVTPAGSASGDLGGTYPGPTVATVGTKTAAAIATSVVDTIAATASSTNSTIVKRDSSGNFAANVITASLTGNVTGNCSGTAATITGALSGDVTSSGMVTTLSTVNSNVGTFGTATTVPHITIDGKGRITACTSTTISGVTPAGSISGGDLNGSSYPSPSVATVGGATASAIATATAAANNATAVATNNTIALRDAQGNCAFTGIANTINVVSFSATPTFDLRLGGIQTMSLTGNVTSSTISNLSAGMIVIFDIIQDPTTSRTFVWPANVHGGFTIDATHSSHNAQAFYCDGSALWPISRDVVGTI